MTAAHWMRRHKGGLLATAALAAFVLLLFSTSGPFRSVSGQGVTASEANARLWHGHLPTGATDVWFTSGYRGTRLECTIEPADFFAWCQRGNWEPSPITADSPIYTHSKRDGAVVAIR